MRIAVCAAVWRRYKITAAYWRFVAHLREWWSAHEVVAVAAGSDDPNHAQMAIAAEAEYIDVPNQPLGRKYNAMLGAANRQRVDAVMVMGSDDVFSEEVALALLPYLERDKPYVGLKDLYFYDTVMHRLGYWPGYDQRHRRGEPAGCGRILPRVYLDAVNWRLWDPAQHRGVDHSSFVRLQARGIGYPELVTVKDIGGCAVDLKGPDNLWTMQQVGPRPEPDLSALLKLPADVIGPFLPSKVAA